MPVIEVNNRGVHIQEMNIEATETVLLIHGMFSNLSVYYFNIANILARQFHVLMYDLKSHGLSERTPEGYDLDSMSDDLLALMESRNLDQVNLAGYSFGGLIALKMALRFPERVKKLVMIEAPDPKDDKTRDIIDDYSREFLEHYVANFTDTTRVRMGKRQMERNHRMYEYLFQETSIKKDMRQERDFFDSSEIEVLPHKTLLLYGAGSNCFNAGRQLKEKMKHAAFIALDGDHNIPIQQPVAVGEQINTFLEEA